MLQKCVCLALMKMTLVQIICARLKILALPPGQAAVPPGALAAGAAQQGAAGQPGLGRGALAPDILRGGWLPGTGQEKLLPRLRCAVCYLSAPLGLVY